VLTWLVLCDFRLRCRAPFRRVGDPELPFADHLELSLASAINSQSANP
jgi:hypothetical protein